MARRFDVDDDDFEDDSDFDVSTDDDLPRRKYCCFFVACSARENVSDKRSLEDVEPNSEQCCLHSCAAESCVELSGADTLLLH